MSFLLLSPSCLLTYLCFCPVLLLRSYKTTVQPFVHFDIESIEILNCLLPVYKIAVIFSSVTIMSNLFAPCLHRYTEVKYYFFIVLCY